MRRVLTVALLVGATLAIAGTPAGAHYPYETVAANDFPPAWFGETLGPDYECSMREGQGYEYQGEIVSSPLAWSCQRQWGRDTFGTNPLNSTPNPVNSTLCGGAVTHWHLAWGPPEGSTTVSFQCGVIRLAATPVDQPVGVPAPFSCLRRLETTGRPERPLEDTGWFPSDCRAGLPGWPDNPGVDDRPLLVLSNVIRNTNTGKAKLTAEVIGDPTTWGSEAAFHASLVPGRFVVERTDAVRQDAKWANEALPSKTLQIVPTPKAERILRQEGQLTAEVKVTYMRTYREPFVAEKTVILKRR